MESLATTLIIFLSISLTLSLLKHLLLPRHSKKLLKPVLPPSASFLPVFIHIIFHRRSVFEIAPILRRLHSLHGPIITLRVLPFSRPIVVISDASLAHSALIHHGSAFADRFPIKAPTRILTGGNCNISDAPYGSLWRLFRRNLSANTLHPSRIRLFAPARRWALQLLVDTLHSQSGQVVSVKGSFKHAIFSLLVLMCFGEKLDEKEIREIESPFMFLLSLFTSFDVFAVVPTVTKVLFRKKWKKIIDVRRRQEEIFLPMISARRDRKHCPEEKQTGYECCYVDSLLDIRLPDDGGRGLNDDEIVSLCHEFLAGGIDTTVTALEWTMAELVRNKGLQSNLLSEIESLAGSLEEDIVEDDLQRMPLLKAVVMESLRRHPPGHFLLPHSVTEDVNLDGFLIEKGVEVLFSVADVNFDGRTWEEPMKFLPERFLAGAEGGEVDITGSREIKMMPFGAGRRMCPGYGLAMLHLEFFVANLVREFVWMPEEGKEVDLSEKLEFTVVMKNPLRAETISRRNNKKAEFTW